MNKLFELISSYEDHDSSYEDQYTKCYQLTEIKHVSKYIYKCEKYKFVNKCFDKDDAVWCKQCDDYSSFVNDLENKCQYRDFLIEHEKRLDGSKYDDHILCKIKLDIDDVGYYGVLETIAVFEPNEWSSTPHDDYYFNYWLFTKPKIRNRYFKKLLVK